MNIQNKKSNKNKHLKITKSSIKELLSWLVGGFILLFVTEYIQRQDIQSIITFAKDRTNAFVINLLIILILTSIIFLLKRKKTAYFLISLLIISISLISAFMTNLRGMPLTYSDIFSIRDGMSIANKYINIYMIIGVVLALVICILITVYLFKQEKNSIRITSPTNIILAIIIAIVFTVSATSLRERKILDALRWDLKESYYYNGFVYSVLDSWYSYIRKKPEGYDKAQIENIKNNMNAVPAMSSNGTQVKKVSTDKKPNIMFVQLESFMDPTLIKEAKFSEDPIPNFRKLSKENTSGVMNAPTTGGGTARTEFEVLTGNNFDYLIPGEIPYDTIAKQKAINSVASTLKKQGYKATIIHNFQGNFYSRNTALNNLGFDRFVSMEYMQGIEKTPLNWSKDKVLKEYMQQSLESTVEKDLIYVITAQCHSKYPENDLGIDMPVKVEVQAPLTETDKNQLYYYANQLKETDEYIGETIKMVNEMKEDTIVVFFSDHMPALNVFKNDDFYLDKYEVPVGIYANYNTGQKQNLDLEAYQLSTELFTLAGAEYGPMERIHALLRNDENYQKDLESMQYDILFGKQYSINSDKDKPIQGEMRMGLFDITVDKVDKKGNTTTIKGKNFTQQSVVYVNNKKCETKFINDKTLEIKSVDKMDTVSVKQLGRNDAQLSSSNEIKIK